MQQGEESSSRFWEFYALRYSVGAVLGAIILFFLVQKNKALAALIFVKPGEPIDLVQVGIFLGVGLVYSYLASAPILVFHAGRFLISKGPLPFLSVERISSAIYVVICANLALTFSLISSLEGFSNTWFSVVIFLACYVLVTQIVIVVKCVLQRDNLYCFYKNLAIKRKQSSGGLIDSYRHLREHGNAFGIVLFEIILGIFMFAAPTYMSIVSPGSHEDIYSTMGILTVVVIFWITPASLVWLIGTIIERELVDS